MKDVFLSHASQDKQAFVMPLARRLDEAGISYWLDEAEIRWGDKISASIGAGLSNSKFVIVFITPSFLGRNWTETELSAALSRENDEGRTVVLPIVTDNPQTLLSRYPLLRDKKYLEWTENPDVIVTELQNLIFKSRMGSLDKPYLNDDLTGVFNRRCICDLLSTRIDDVKNRKAMLALLFVDLDRFKILNDTLGHQFGDNVLVEVAKRLITSIDDAASVGRLGGDEFLIILEISSREQVQALAERLLQSISAPMTVSGQQCQITATIGISIFPKDGQDMHELLRTADISVYRGKHKECNTFIIYDATLDLRGEL
ncbi:MAG: diguanylate cyclase [Methylococcaceae bacterium]|nr:diguanylate cyclase [Methylococcaceae bacterium]